MVATHLSSARDAPHEGLSLWTGLSRLIKLLIFTQSIFAGLMLSGHMWGRTIHRLSAVSLIVITLIALVIAIRTLRQTAAGRRMISMLGLVAICIVAQTIIGIMSAQGESLLWLHIPFGVALIGIAETLEPAATALQPDAPDDIA